MKKTIGNAKEHDALYILWEGQTQIKLETVKEGVPVNKSQYHRLLGRLLYLSRTRPDIEFTISMVSQFMHCPYNNILELSWVQCSE